MLNLTRTADYLSAQLKELGFIIMSKGRGKGLPLVAFRLKSDHNLHYDEYAIAHHLRERGWVVPAYTMAPHSEKLKLMRVVVREDFSRNKCDSLLADVKIALQSLDEMDKKTVEQFQQYVHALFVQLFWAQTDGSGSHAHKHLTNSGKSSHNHSKFKNEKHSLQGKHGKTHAPC